MKRIGIALRRQLARPIHVLLTAGLNLVVTKPIAIFVWWLGEGANRATFHRRADLCRRVKRARREGRAVLFASNHLSMFDDPVVPMILFRTGLRALTELAGLSVLAIACALAAPELVPEWLGTAVLAGYAAAIALGGARKTWWSLGDLVNFSGVSALRGKLEVGRSRPLSSLVRGLLALADPVIFAFMRSRVVKTVLVDRRPGEEARKLRARAVDATIEIAARAEPVWIFFEGGRSRVPDRIGEARHGIGSIAIELERRGARPLVFAIHHRGLEHVMPIGSRQWIRRGYLLDIRWSEVDVGALVRSLGRDADPQSIADAVRDEVVGLQSAWHREQAAA